MGSLKKYNFAAGMSTQLDPTKSNIDTEYYLGINVRVRTNTVRPVAAPLDITSGLPAGKLQGLYTFDTNLLAFVAGQAFYKVGGAGNWLPIYDLQLDADVDEIDVELVPTSTLNFRRAAPTSTTQEDNAVVLTTPQSSSPQCLVCCDGVGQPWIILPDATARITQTYADWAPENPEYVPAAVRFPLYINGILFLVGKDLSGGRTQIYRSVSGQPLNFVILLNADGNKVDANETLGGAPVLAHRVSYNDITGISVINAGPDSFLVSTSAASWLVTLDYTNTIAAEPTFANQYLFDLGMLNKNCVINILGMTCVVGKSGIRSFNGVQQINWSGDSEPFSAQINNLIANQDQIRAACFTYDAYALFSLQTIYGPAVVVYDMIIQKFVSLDIYDNVGQIVQFASVVSGSTERLYAYTVDDEVIQVFAGAAQRAALYLTDMTPPEEFGGHRITDVYCNFGNIATDGYCAAIAYTDRVAYSAGAQGLEASNESLLTPVSLPYNSPTSYNGVQQRTFGFTPLTNSGWRVSAGILWDAAADLLELGIETEDNTGYANKPTQSTVPVADYVIAFTANDNILAATPVATIRGQNTFDMVIGGGDHTVGGTQNSINTIAIPHWDVNHVAGGFFAAPGEQELATTNGEPWYQYLLQGPDHYSKQSFTSYLDVFFITAGYLANGTQVEPSNLTQATVLASQQMVWLRDELAASTARYKVVVWYNAAHTSNPYITPRLTEIPLESWGADLLLTGQGRMYERLVLDNGFVEINNGTGGGSLYTEDFLEVDAASKKIVQNTYGYVELTVNPLRLEIRFKNTAGELLDYYAL